MRKLVLATVLAGDNWKYECGNDSWNPLLRKMATGEKGPATAGLNPGPTHYHGASATRKVKHEASSLNRWLSRFIGEARHGDSTHYPPKMIQALLAWGSSDTFVRQQCKSLQAFRRKAILVSKSCIKSLTTNVVNFKVREYAFRQSKLKY